jgi:hypothetical protein
MALRSGWLGLAVGFLGATVPGLQGGHLPGAVAASETGRLRSLPESRGSCSVDALGVTFGPASETQNRWPDSLRTCRA